MESAVRMVQLAMAAIKKSTNFTWSLPYLKMPHITINGSWNMDPPQAPSFSVRWYKDAMNSGIILNSPTIFGMMNGQLLGGGDAGSELVVGTENLMSMIRRVVESFAEGSRFQTTLEAALKRASESMIDSFQRLGALSAAGTAGGLDSATGRMLLSMLSQYLPYLPQIANLQVVTETGVLVGVLAPKMDQRLGVISSRQKRQ